MATRSRPSRIFLLNPKIGRLQLSLKRRGESYPSHIPESAQNLFPQMDVAAADIVVNKAAFLMMAPRNVNGSNMPWSCTQA
jgi:hypothetical protein